MSQAECCLCARNFRQAKMDQHKTDSATSCSVPVGRVIKSSLFFVVLSSDADDLYFRYKVQQNDGIGEFHLEHVLYINVH